MWLRLVAALLFFSLFTLGCKNPRQQASNQGTPQPPAQETTPASREAPPPEYPEEAMIALASYDQAAADYRSDYLTKKTSVWSEYVNGQDEGWAAYSEKQKADWQNYVNQQQQGWQQYSAAQQQAWQDYTSAEKEKWDQYVRDVEAKWGQFQGSTKTEWVDYGGGYDSKSYVDFKGGSAVFEVLVDASAANLEGQAQAQLRAMINAALAQKDVGNQRILDGQISDPQGLQNAVKQPIPRGTVTGKDGVKRVRYAVATKLVPDHLRRRAERYMGLINQFSGQYNLDASLVLAITETESAFNPRAQSWANAYGLMQIVPKYAGRETWKEINGQDGIPSGEYLFDPSNNVKHGSCYLHLLMDKHWGGVAEGSKKEFLVICSYNCGPGNVNKMVLKKHGGPEQHSDQEMYNLLTSYTPEETQNYLRRVTERRPKWKGEN